MAHRYCSIIIIWLDICLEQKKNSTQISGNIDSQLSGLFALAGLYDKYGGSFEAI